MTFGVPMLVLPFSTDQFAGAAAIEHVDAGVVLPPNTASVDELAKALVRVLGLPRHPLTGVAGREVAYAAMAAGGR